MNKDKQFIVSHAPFWHNGSSIPERNVNIILAALIAVIPGIFQYGLPAIAVVSLSVSMAMIWELALNWLTKRPVSIGDGNAALMGLLFSMLIPATTPFWVVITGTFLVVVIGKQIFGGIGANPFHPVLIGLAIIRVSWGEFFDFDQALLNYDLGFHMAYPLAALKSFGTSAIESFSALDLLMGKQIGGIGATFGIGLILGGIYLILRGFIRWEISVSFLAGIFISAFIFNQVDPSKYAGPLFHLLTGYTLIGAFFLSTDDSSSPVNFIPMLIYGLGCGIMTILIRNIGAYVDGVVFAILLMNLTNPLIDKIRPKAMGKVM
ncbi:MAG: RnfABCDGE type electron transport complex subunit D [Deltaproteobacteria bacterium]|nr:RnfABCDGE type electron transport complex subunit D [Deltaproteobacteria bacterium]